MNNFYRLFMQLEHTWSVYQKVEIDALYASAKMYVDGFRLDTAKLKDLEAADQEVYRANEIILNDYLMEKGVS